MAQPQTVIVQQRPPTTLIVQHPQEDKSAFLRTATLVSQVTFSIFASFYLLLLMIGACRSDEQVRAQALAAFAGKNGEETSAFLVSWWNYMNWAYREEGERGVLVLSIMHVVFLWATAIAINVARCTPMFVTSTRKTVSTVVFLGLVKAAMLTVFIITVVRIAKFSKIVNDQNDSMKLAAAAPRRVGQVVINLGMPKNMEFTTAPMWMAEIWAFLIPLVCMPLIIVGWFKLPAGDENKGYATTTYGTDAQAGDDI